MVHLIDTPAKYDAAINQFPGGRIDGSLLSSKMNQLATEFSHGVQLEGEGRLEQANGIYARVLARWPTFVAARFNYANNLRAMGELEQAQQQIDIALVNGGNKDKDVVTFAGVLLGDLDDPISELAMYHRAHQLDPNDKRPLFFMVTTYRQLGLWTVARGWLELLDQQIRPLLKSSPQLVDPDHVARLEWNWGQVHAHFENWHEAAEHYERLFEMSGDPAFLKHLQDARSRLTSATL